MGPVIIRLTAEDGEFALSEEQLASARDPHCTLRALTERPEPARARRVGRPWFVWRDDLELARTLNDRLAEGAAG